MKVAQVVSNGPTDPDTGDFAAIGQSPQCAGRNRQGFCSVNRLQQ
jgi:hypothetical protein